MRGATAIRTQQNGRVRSHGDAPQALVSRVREAISTHRLLPRGERVLLGVSGGADSVALLQTLMALRTDLDLHLHIVHVDHQLRPDSADDAGFVRALGERLGVPVTVVSCDVPGACREAGWSLEEGARRLRYGAFTDVAQRYSASAVAVAHTADDQAETVLLRLVRGCSLAGLGGMPMQRPLDRDGGRGEGGEVRLVRPLLEVWRHEVRAAVAAANWSYREDPSNADRRFLRNRIRHELLPLLERDYNPKIRHALVQLAAMGREDADWLDAACAARWKRVAKELAAGRVSLRISSWARQPATLQRHLVREAIERVGGDLGLIEFRHWREVDHLFAACPPGTVVDLPGGVRWVRQAEHVICERLPDCRREAYTCSSRS